MKKLPLIRVAEVAFLTAKTKGSARFYRQLGLPFDEKSDLRQIHFVDVGEQYFGFADRERGFFTGYDEEFVKPPLHVAFEIPSYKIDDCVSFLRSGVSCAAPRLNILIGMVQRSPTAYTLWTLKET